MALGKGRRSHESLEMLLSSLLNTSLKGMSGYELAATLKEPIPFIWPVKHSQIYPALAGLEERGDIVGKWVEQRGRPSKKSYVLSAQGRERLRAWLLEPRGALTQEEVMLTVYNLNLIGFDAVERGLKVYRRQCENEKLQLDKRWKIAEERLGGRPDNILLGVRGVYELAFRVRDGRIAWCSWVLDKARAAEANASRTAGARARKAAKS